MNESMNRAKLRLQMLFGRYLTSGLMGISVDDWWELLKNNNFRLAPQYLPRAVFISFFSVINFFLRNIDEKRYGKKLINTTVSAPLIIVGHWRGGTTHLHQLLSLTPNLAAPNLCEVMHPHSFLSCEQLLAKLLQPLLPETRIIDNMPLGLELPQEEEFALAQLTAASPYLSYAFPQSWDHYDRFLTFAECTPEEIKRWQKALDSFLRKLMLKRKGRPLLKSPASTGRLSHLIDLYPQAQIIHISRHPFRIFASTKHMLHLSIPLMQMQMFNEEQLNDRIISRYKIMYEAYFRDRSSLTPGQLHELRYEDLIRRPIEELESLFKHLRLPHYHEFKKRIKTYLGKVAGYQPQTYPPLSGALKQRIKVEWNRCFTAWDYKNNSGD